MLNYTRATDLALLNEEVYVATESGVFIYDKRDNSTRTLTKVNGLSDVGIVSVTAAPAHGIVLVGYRNGNLDIIRGREITNFRDIRNSTLQGDKAIRHVEPGPQFIYISTGLGIHAFDPERREVRNTYRITATEDVSVNTVSVQNDTICAATDAGLYLASLNDDLTIFSNWHIDLSTPDPFGNVRHCVLSGGNKVGNFPDASPPGLYAGRPDGTWESLLAASDIGDLRRTPGGVILSTTGSVQRRGPGGEGVTANFTAYNGITARPNASLSDDAGIIWSADNDNGLVRRDESSAFEFIAPDGPGSNGCFRLTLAQGELWVASGAPQRPGVWRNGYRRDGYYKYSGGRWTNFTRDVMPIFDDELFFDIPEVFRFPGNEERLMVGSWYSGAIEVNDGEVTAHFNEENSSLTGSDYTRSDGKEWIAASGFSMDDNGDLWMVTVRSDNPLSVYRSDGTWQNFPINTTRSDACIGQTITRDGNHWIAVNRQGIRVFDPEGENTRTLIAQTGNGGLPSNEVYAVTEDLDGTVWVGTADGIGVFFSPFDIFSQNPSDARPIIVEQDGIFQPLFENQLISCITVDGANRKWVGTFGSGVFLISADGTDEIHRFTASNSPLLSNIINDVAVDDATGEVYIATENGLMTYTSDATAGGFQNACTTVFPNPVRETYSGPVTIRGLMRDTEVRITDVRGNLVAAITSAGGTAVWDAKNRNNERVATGVYFALSSDPDGESTCVSKILVIK